MTFCLVFTNPYVVVRSNDSRFLFTGISCNHYPHPYEGEMDHELAFNSHLIIGAFGLSVMFVCLSVCPSISSETVRDREVKFFGRTSYVCQKKPIDFRLN